LNFAVNNSRAICAAFSPKAPDQDDGFATVSRQDEPLSTGRELSILHLDMDAFYAAVEERDNPALKGKPVIVGGSPQGRGVVSTANYEARRFGVHSAMPAAQARRQCPDGIFLRPRMSVYVGISARLREIFARYTPLIEPLSLDEAFLDVTASRRLFGTPVSIAKGLKNTIRDELDLVASVGVAPNKFLAKLASDLSKPDGLLVVDPDGVREFLDPLPVSRLWGVGAAAERKLQAMGIYTVAELRQSAVQGLEQRLGTWGRHIWELAHGRDERRVIPDRDAKSISHETTFSNDITDPHVLRTWLLDLTEQVARRLRRHDLRARTVELKLRYNDFTTVSRSRSLTEPSDRTRIIWRLVSELFEQQWQRRSDPVRLLGCGVSGFDSEPSRQGDLFDAVVDERDARLDGVMDAISERFGNGIVGRGGAGAKK
jgi:DNA polymerase-4